MNGQAIRDHATELEVIADSFQPAVGDILRDAAAEIRRLSNKARDRVCTLHGSYAQDRCPTCGLE